MVGLTPPPEGKRLLVASVTRGAAKWAGQGERSPPPVPPGVHELEGELQIAGAVHSKVPSGVLRVPTALEPSERGHGVSVNERNADPYLRPGGSSVARTRGRSPSPPEKGDE